MPNPYRKRDGHVHFHPDTLLEHPAMGLQIARVVAEAARMDFWTAIIIARLTNLTMTPDVENDGKWHRPNDKFTKTVAAIYLSLSGSAARSAVAKTLRERSLTAAQDEALAGLIKRGKSLSSQRNDIVHGLWGYDPSMPDALILQRIEDAVEYGIDPGETVTAQVYKLADFAGLIRDIQQLNSDLAKFRPWPAGI